MVNTSWFPTATEARNNIIKDVAIHSEIRAIEEQVLAAVARGDYEVTVANNSPMTRSSTVGTKVFSADAATGSIVVPGHTFKTGDSVRVYSTIELPPPLDDETFYSVIYVDPNTIRLAASRADALSNRPTSIQFNLGVGSVAVNTAGSGYLTAPYVNFVGGNATSSASAKAYLSSSGSVYSVNTLVPGNGFESVPSATVGSVGQGAVPGNASFCVVDVSIHSGGNLYNVGDILTVDFDPGVPAVLRVTETSGGAVTQVSIVDPGSFSSVPVTTGVPTTASGSGNGCSVNIVLGISRITVINGGQEYLSAPQITISGGGGTGAQARASLVGGSVGSIQIVTAGSGYLSQPSVSINNGSGAQVLVRLKPSGLGAVSLTNNGGSTYSSPPALTITPAGSGATISSLTLKSVGVDLVNNGVGYVTGDTLLASGGIASRSVAIQVLSVNSTGAIQTFNVIDSGSYTDLPQLFANNVIGGSGAGASFNISMGIETVTIGSGGSQYTAPPLVVFTGVGTSALGATAQTVISQGVVTSVTVTSPGSGYLSMPGATISNGSGAIAQAILAGTSIAAVTIINQGSGYLTNPQVTLSGGGGTGAQITAQVIAGKVMSVTLVNPGSGYTSLPQISIEGNAQLSLSLSPAPVDRIVVTAPGANYVDAPAITISGAATARASLIPTTIAGIDVVDGGSLYASDPLVIWSAGVSQISSPVYPITRVNRSFSLNSITVTGSGTGYQSTPQVVLSAPSIGGTPAQATASLSAGAGIVSIESYSPSQDYFLVWKNQTPSDSKLSRPMQDQMTEVVNYFTNIGYTITRTTNPATNNTLAWSLRW